MTAQSRSIINRMEHIDKYQIDLAGNQVRLVERIDGDGARALEAQRQEQGLPLPYFGDYVVITSVHEDGECDQQGLKEGPLFSSPSVEQAA